jgi:hypothetical protein
VAGGPRLYAGSRLGSSQACNNRGLLGRPSGSEYAVMWCSAHVGGSAGPGVAGLQWFVSVPACSGPSPGTPVHGRVEVLPNLEALNRETISDRKRKSKIALELSPLFLSCPPALVKAAAPAAVAAADSGPAGRSRSPCPLGPAL